MRYGHVAAEARARQKAKAKARKAKAHGGSRRTLAAEANEEAEEDSAGGAGGGDGGPLAQIAQCFFFADAPDFASGVGAAWDPAAAAAAAAATTAATPRKPPPPPLPNDASGAGRLPKGSFASPEAAAPEVAHLDVAAVRALNPAASAHARSAWDAEAARAKLRTVRFDLKR